MYNVEIVTNIEYPLNGPVAHTSNLWKSCDQDKFPYMPACYCSNSNDCIGDWNLMVLWTACVCTRGGLTQYKHYYYFTLYN